MSENAPSNTSLDTPIAQHHRLKFESTAARDGLIRGDVDRHERDPLRNPQERAAYFRRKYIADRWLGGVLLVLTAPLTLTLFVIVKLTSPGPGFYRQERVGLNGTTFYVVKLRSMVVNAERPGEAVWCVPNDARITWLGKVLRKLHLDELPQLYNVVRGDMCLVGPRPERPKICEDLARQIDGYYDRNAVKPGITGLAQINLPPDVTIEDVRKKQILDLDYIENANFWLDIRMITLTALYTLAIKGEGIIKFMGLCRQDLLAERLTGMETDAEYLSPTCNDVELAVFGDASGQSERVGSVSARYPR